MTFEEMLMERSRENDRKVKEIKRNRTRRQKCLQKGEKVVRSVKE
jgi:hypothetical protein